MDIKREVQIDKLLKKGIALLIYGARQVGKTTLVKNFLLKNKSKFRQHTGEDIQLQILFKDLSIADLDEFVENLEILIIDEAQILENLGRGIKLILDRLLLILNKFHLKKILLHY
jgi:predicted AAA+ superfamily ATPase